MKAFRIRHALIATAALALAPAAYAQNEDVAEKANEIAEKANEAAQEAGALANEVATTQAAEEGREDGEVDRDGNGTERANAARDDDDGFDWGLLGLLGLAGLLGLKRDNRRDVHTNVGRDTNRL